LVAAGVHIGLMIDIAHSEGQQVQALAPSVDGSNSMAYCVAFGVYSGHEQQNNLEIILEQATLQSDVTKLLGKGCTLAGSFVVQPSNAPSLKDGLQPMLCPKALVGTTPVSSVPSGGGRVSNGNTGKCLV
jgi:hypothetical protein